MKQFTSPILVIALTAALAATGLGQGGPAGPMGPGGPHGQFGPGGPQGPGAPQGPGGPLMRRGGPRLLAIPEVQRELALTDSQKVQLEAILPKRGDGPEGPDRPRDGRRSGPPGAGGHGRPGGLGGPGRPGGPGGEVMTRIAQVLNASQMQRFRELSLQFEGAVAIGRPDIAETLALSDDQLERVRESARPPRPDTGNEDLTLAQKKARLDQHRRETETKILAILSAGQRTKWAAMLGRPFVFPEPPRR